MSKNYTQQELNDLIAKVEASFAADLAKAEEELKTSVLAKNEDEEGKEKEEEKQEMQIPEPKAEDEKEEKEDEDKKEDDYREYDEQELEELHKLYKAMHPNELSHHHNAIKKAMGIEDQPMMQKSEDKSSEIELQKSEIESLKKANDDLKKAVAMIAESFNKKKASVAPKQQAIVELTTLAKSEEKQEKQLDRKEVVRMLSKVAETPDLQKSDRELINRYCVGNGTLDSIKHLLK